MPVVKVLVVSTPGGGHVTPLVPLIDALLAGGDEVVVASGPDAEPIIAKTGARFCVAGRTGGDYLALLTQETEHERRGIPPIAWCSFSSREDSAKSWPLR